MGGECALDKWKPPNFYFLQQSFYAPCWTPLVYTHVLICRFLSLPSQEWICSSEKKFSDQDLKINWSLNSPKPFTWIAKPLRSFLSLGFLFLRGGWTGNKGDPILSRETVHQLAQFTAIKKKKKKSWRQAALRNVALYYLGLLLLWKCEQTWAFVSLDTCFLLFFAIYSEVQFLGQLATSYGLPHNIFFKYWLTIVLLGFSQ